MPVVGIVNSVDLYLLVLFSLGHICTVILIFSALFPLNLLFNRNNNNNCRFGEINITDSNIMELSYFMQVLVALTYEVNHLVAPHRVI